MRVMAFDYGLATIGVAVGDTVTGTTQDCGQVSVRHDKDTKDKIPDWEAVQALVKDWKPHKLIVGLPLHMNGQESAMSKKTRRFAIQMQENTGIRCDLTDERLSSVEAKARLGRQSETGRIHGVSAEVILETWFSANANKSI